MSYETERKIIEQRFETAWAGRCPVQYGDMNFEAPDADPWARITILNGDNANGSVGAPGANLVRHAGIVAIQIHLPVGSDTATWTGYAQAVEDVFRNYQEANMRFGVPYVSGGAIMNGKFSTRTMFCPYQRDELNG